VRYWDGAAIQTKNAQGTAGEGSAAGENNVAEADGEDVLSSSPEMLTATWYPTLERTLSSLAKLYLSVDPPVFEDLAHEVRHCAPL
jgi:hypothetical protein